MEMGLEMLGEKVVHVCNMEKRTTMVTEGRKLWNIGKVARRSPLGLSMASQNRRGGERSIVSSWG